jgi:hypothetical protein
MSDHDLASVVAGMAGLGGQGGTWTPARLIEVFCEPMLESSWHSEKREHSEWHAGFCSFNGKGSYGAGVDGFDDGYDCMGHLEESGWRAIGEYGNWPYVMYFWWAPRDELEGPDARPCIAHYCEGDFAVEVFDSIAAARAAKSEWRRQP